MKGEMGQERKGERGEMLSKMEAWRAISPIDKKQRGARKAMKIHGIRCATISGSNKFSMMIKLISEGARAPGGQQRRDEGEQSAPRLYHDY